MKYNKGFAPLVVLLIVLGVLAVGGVVYFAGKSSAPKNEVSDNSNYLPTTEQNYTPPATTNNNPPTQTPPSSNNNSTTPESSGLPAPIFTTNSATNITSNSATLNASISGLMDPIHGTGQQSYFQYGTSSTNLSLTSSINGPTQGSLSKVVSGLQPNTTYYFRVAINYGPNSVPANSHQYGNVLNFKTQNSTTTNGTGIWAPGLYKVEITKNSIPTISTNCCGGWIDGGNGGSGYIQSGETRYAIYGAGNSTNYIDVYFILGPESSFPSPVIDPNNIITSTQNEFNVNYFQLARVNINQTVILNNNNVSIKLKFIERTGTQGCPAGTAC